MFKLTDHDTLQFSNHSGCNRKEETIVIFLPTLVYLYRYIVNLYDILHMTNKILNKNKVKK